MYPHLRCNHRLYFHPQSNPHQNFRRLYFRPRSNPHPQNNPHQSYSGLPVQLLLRLPVLQLPQLLQQLLPLPDVLLLPQRRYALPQAARSLPAAERSGWNTQLPSAVRMRSHCRSLQSWLSWYRSVSEGLLTQIRIPVSFPRVLPSPVCTGHRAVLPGRWCWHISQGSVCRIHTSSVCILLW